MQIAHTINGVKLQRTLIETINSIAPTIGYAIGGKTAKYSTVALCFIISESLMPVASCLSQTGERSKGFLDEGLGLGLAKTSYIFSPVFHTPTDKTDPTFISAAEGCAFETCEKSGTLNLVTTVKYADEGLGTRQAFTKKLGDGPRIHRLY